MLSEGEREGELSMWLPPMEEHVSAGAFGAGLVKAVTFAGEGDSRCGSLPGTKSSFCQCSQCLDQAGAGEGRTGGLCVNYSKATPSFRAGRTTEASKLTETIES